MKKHPKQCNECGNEWRSEYEYDVFDECPKCGSEDWYVVTINDNGDEVCCHGPYGHDHAVSLLPYERDNLRDGWFAVILTEEQRKKVQR